MTSADLLLATVRAMKDYQDLVDALRKQIAALEAQLQAKEKAADGS